MTTRVAVLLLLVMVLMLHPSSWCCFGTAFCVFFKGSLSLLFFSRTSSEILHTVSSPLELRSCSWSGAEYVVSRRQAG